MRKLIVLLTALVGALVGTLSCLNASAQQFPSRPIRVMVGFAPGGVSDLVARVLADEMGRSLGQPVVVENHPGVAGLLAANLVKNAPPDGYSLLSGSVIAFAPQLLKASLVASKELTPISQIAAGDLFIYASTSLPIQNLKDLQAYAKTNTVKFASGAPLNSMLMALVAKKIGIKFDDILYKTTDQIVAAVLSGDTQISMSAAGGFESSLAQNKIRVISTLSSKRLENMPNALTAKEQGVDVELYSSLSLWTAPKVPADIVTKLNTAAVQALKAPVVVQKIRGFSFTAAGSTPQELLKRYEADLRVMTEAAEASGYQPL